VLITIPGLVIAGLVVNAFETGDQSVGVFFALMLFGVPVALTALLLLVLGLGLGAWQRPDDSEAQRH
jgi:hypothetical protein